MLKNVKLIYHINYNIYVKEHLCLSKIEKKSKYIFQTFAFEWSKVLTKVILPHNKTNRLRHNK